MQTGGEMLKLWASLSVPRLHPLNDWSAVNRTIAASRLLISGDIRELEVALAVSNRFLSPLEDPFCADFGLHRWLAGDREESYSDWLQYVVLQLGRPDLVYRLFHLKPPPGIERSAPKLSAREFPMDTEDPGRSRRLDLIIVYPGAAPLVIEVKITTAETADTYKQEEYSSLVSAEYGNCDKVLLVTGAASASSHGDFRVQLWLDLAKELRRIVPGLCTSQRVVVAAMLLAFAGAIEQNLCGLPGWPLKLLKAGITAGADRVISYLQETIRDDR
jgi:hypothetical protein